MRVGQAIAAIVNRLPLGENGRQPQFNLNGLPEQLSRFRLVTQTLRHTSTAEVLFKDVEDLRVEEFRTVITEVLTFVRRCAEELTLIRSSVPLKSLINRYATMPNVIRTLTDQQTLLDMARMQPLAMPRNLDDVYTRPDHLVRTGHPRHSLHRELPISAELYGSKLVSYFVVSGEAFPSNKPDLAIPKLIAHDSDEFVIFLGMPTDTSVRCQLPIYKESEFDPYQNVRNPVTLNSGDACIYDGKAPHFWYAPPNSIAFFVTAARGGLFRKPIAFQWQHQDSAPGGAFPLFKWTSEEPSQRKRSARNHLRGEPDESEFADEMSEPGNDRLTHQQLERTSYLIGGRLQRRRNAYQLSANDVQYLKRGRPIRANIIGKIENNAISTLTLRTVLDYAEAIDLTIGELFARDPPYNTPRKVALNGSNVTALFDESGQRDPFAVAPFVVNPPRPGKANGFLHFWEGEADIVLLPLKGKVAVYIVPDPLLLALELKPDDFDRHATSDAHAFSLKRAAIQRLISKQQQLLLRDEVDENNAYHFNAALPHAFEAVDEHPGAASSRSDDKTLVVTTRNDRDLPHCWVDPASRLDT